MIVVDNSVVVLALIGSGAQAEACAARLANQALVAPALIDVEVASALRGLVRGGKVSSERARAALAGLAQLPIERVLLQDFLPRIWSLRDNLTAYDAAYVAIAEALMVTLVTGDPRLANAPGSRCAIELIS